MASAEITIRVDIGTHIFEVMECVDEIIYLMPECQRGKASELRSKAADLLCDMMVSS